MRSRRSVYQARPLPCPLYKSCSFTWGPDLQVVATDETLNCNSLLMLDKSISAREILGYLLQVNMGECGKLCNSSLNTYLPQQSCSYTSTQEKREHMSMDRPVGEGTQQLLPNRGSSTLAVCLSGILSPRQFFLSPVVDQGWLLFGFYLEIEKWSGNVGLVLCSGQVHASFFWFWFLIFPTNIQLELTAY